MRRRGRELNIFSMSFLDAITAGFGAVVLLFMLVSQIALLDSRGVVDEVQAEANRWEIKVLTSQKNLVQLKEQLDRQRQRRAVLRELRQKLLGELQDTETQLVTLTEDSAARRSVVEKLRAEVAALERQAQETRAAAARPGDRGYRLRSFVGEGNRQYLTSLRMGGKRVVILVDTSTSMLDRTIVNVLRRRNMPPDRQRRAPKWQQAVNTVDWLTTQLESGTQTQLIRFSDQAESLIPGTNGQWVTITDGSELDAGVDSLRASLPQGPSSLHAAFAAARALEPKPDNIYLVTDGLPTMGKVLPTREGVTSRERLNHFNRALRELPVGIPVNVILLAMEGDPLAAPAYWLLALQTGGSMLSPAEDWP